MTNPDQPVHTRKGVVIPPATKSAPTPAPLRRSDVSCDVCHIRYTGPPLGSSCLRSNCTGHYETYVMHA